MGAVWPFVTGFLAWGHFRYDRPWAGYPLVDAFARMGFDFARGRHPELLSGAYYRPLDTAVPQQFFATSMLVTPVLAGLLGFEPGEEVSLRPALPAHWDRLAVRRLRVNAGKTRLDVSLRRVAQRLEVELRAEGPTTPVVLSPLLPPGARHVRVAGAQPVSGTAEAVNARVDASESPRTTIHPSESIRPGVGARESVRVRTDTGAQARTVVFTWEGGLEPEPILADLEPGQTDRGLRLLEWRPERDGWRAEVEGQAGRTYELAVRGERIAHVSGAEIVGRQSDRTRVRVALAAGEGTARATPFFRP
jgi:hypothetical protein